MANTVRKTSDDLALLEEQVDSGLTQFLSEYHPEFTPGGGAKKDELAKRFTFFPNKPIPDLSHEFANAYAAEDSFNNARNTYAMVLTNTIPCRQHTVAELTGFSNPHLSQLLGSGTVNCSHLGESRLVLFFERPAGKLLSQAMRETPRLHEHVVSDYVLGPGIRGLLALREKKTAHGNIGPESFFMGETPALRECISSPTATLNHHVYLALEMLLTDPISRGEATEKTDVYALGILALELMHGIDRQKAMPREELIRALLAKGSYITYVAGREFSAAFEDLLRGILNDDPEERWGLDEAAAWLAGKRFNMIAPTVAKDANRPFVFGGDNYFNPKVLAHALHRQWRMAAKDLKTSRLDRWCETNVSRVGAGVLVERALRTGGDGANEAQINDMITRVIASLDPKGPIRSIQLAVRPDGIGTTLAKCMADNLQLELAQLIQFIETDISNYWAEHYAEERSNELTQTVWKLQRCRGYLKQKVLGFGLERVLYDLNPTLSCQSPLIKQYHVTDVVELLKTLDAIAPNLAPDTSFVDQHIAAFIASKIGMGKEMHLNEIAVMPSLSKNEELIVLKILAKVQSKHHALRLPGLCAWIGTRIEKMLDVIHSRVVRKKIKQRLKKMAMNGRIDEMLTMIINRDIAIRDYDGFTRAIALHQINSGKIERYQNPRLVDYYARDTGGKIASTIAFSILMITAYLVITDVLGI